MSQLGVTNSMALVEYTGGAGPAITGINQQAQQHQQSLLGADFANITAEEVGQLIHHLQEEIKVIRVQLENLPGYATGKNESIS